MRPDVAPVTSMYSVDRLLKRVVGSLLITEQATKQNAFQAK